MNYQQQMDRAYALTEEYLASCFQGEGLEKAMRYSLMAGGKRILPYPDHAVLSGSRR